jgi:hypothetical protein
MMQKFQDFPEFPAGDSQDFAMGSRIPRDFLRESDGLEHTIPNHTLVHAAPKPGT